MVSEELATISVAGNTIASCLGMGSFSTLGNSLNHTIQFAQSLAQGLKSLEIKLESVDTISAVEMRTDMHMHTREEQKATALTLVYHRLDSFIVNVGTVDDFVAQKIDALKNDFYKHYYYLKPNGEKNVLEHLFDAGVAVVELHINIANWCCDHWKLIVTIIIVVVAVVLIVIAPGAGLIAAIIAGACWGAVAGAVIGGVMGGVTSMLNGGSFLTGFENGAFEGAITGAISGAISGGIGFQLGPANTMLQAIGKGALTNSISSGIGNMSGSALHLIMTGEGSIEGILKSGLSGLALGAVIGGVTGGVRFRMSQADGFFGQRSPADTAKHWQGNKTYPGVDQYENIDLTNGQKVYVMESGPNDSHSGYATTFDAVRQSGGSSKALSEGLQIKPFYDKSAEYLSNDALYRPNVTEYVVNTDKIPAGFSSQTLANPQYGTGGMPQYYIKNFDKLVEKGLLVRADTISLTNTTVPVSTYTSMESTATEMFRESFRFATHFESTIANLDSIIAGSSSVLAQEH